MRFFKRYVVGRLQRAWKMWRWRKAHGRMREVREARYRLLKEQIRKEPEERAREEMRRRKVYLKSGMLPERMKTGVLTRRGKY